MVKTGSPSSSRMKPNSWPPSQNSAVPWSASSRLTTRTSISRTGVLWWDGDRSRSSACPRAPDLNATPGRAAPAPAAPRHAEPRRFARRTLLGPLRPATSFARTTGRAPRLPAGSVPVVRFWRRAIAQARKADVPPLRWRSPASRCCYLRSDLNAARISSEKSCGCSQAAKWPPRSSRL